MLIINPLIFYRYEHKSQCVKGRNPFNHMLTSFGYTYIHQWKISTVHGYQYTICSKQVNFVHFNLLLLSVFEIDVTRPTNHQEKVSLKYRYLL